MNFSNADQMENMLFSHHLKAHSIFSKKTQIAEIDRIGFEISPVEKHIIIVVLKTFSGKKHLFLRFFSK